ncbi:unnamed protein product [Auanema sp. JU1783]|nr:unnamed protein product [Auanema sp. JU1783]
MLKRSVLSNNDGSPCKKMKLTADFIIEDDEQLARLRCLGMGLDAKQQGDDKAKLAVTTSAASSLLPASRGSRRTNLTSHEEKELRRERGELLLKLFREVPGLADSASARRAEKNQERALIWDKITNKVNDQFGNKLEYLTVDKVKKLLTYYKKKDDGSYDNIKQVALMEQENLMEEFSITADEPITPERVKTEMDAPRGGVALVEEAIDGNQKLLDFLATVASHSSSSPLNNTSTSASSSSSMSSNSVTAMTTSEEPNAIPMSTIVANDSLYQLKKDRHDFVVGMAEHYMERMCFDNSSRSAAVNAERHNMWVKITQRANDRYATILGPLGVEQAKKLYSNCKRRRRVKAENGKVIEETPSIITSRESISVEPEEMNDVSSNSDEVNDYASEQGIVNFDELLRGLDRTVEVDELRRQIRDKDEEIDRLKKKVHEQAIEYSARIKGMVELLKVAVDKKVADDIKSFFSNCDFVRKDQ